MAEVRTFQELLQAELQDINPGSGPAEIGGTFDVSAGEVPWVTSTQHDLVGLALSGGGVRSATFNLGLLEGLNAHGVLDHVDYLSTVSGGGYIGGWWSSYRKRVTTASCDATKEPPIFPKVEGNLVPEPPEIRHLREFRSYLSPQWGLFRIAMWTAWLSVAQATLLGLITTFCILTIVISLWQAALWLLVRWPAVASCICFVIVAIWTEYLWAKQQPEPKYETHERLAVIVASGFEAVTVLGLGEFLRRSSFLGFLWARGPAWLAPQARALSIGSLSYFGAGALALFAGAFLDCLFRGERRRAAARVAMHAYQRATGRVFGLAIVWSMVAAVWALGVVLTEHGAAALVSTATTSAVAVAAFWKFRDWINDFAAEVASADKRSVLREALPRGLAVVAVATMLLAAIPATIHLARMVDALPRAGAPAASDAYPGAWSWTVIAVLALGAGLFLLMALDPNRSGLQGFYQEKLARTFLSSSVGREPKDDRFTQTRDGDDYALTDLPVTRPIHLVCCTLNDTSGDKLANLSLNAWSATLSRQGLAYQNVCASTPNITLSQALSASAAAFNPNMGFWTTRFGKASTLLMAVLNLRLGLWLFVGNKPGKLVQRTQLHLKEMFGLVKIPTRDGYVHLTDGGHFENLGLYQLVRRHCRYIIVSDCTADPKFEFVDLGNAIRRIRADFGVEVKIDYRRLAPAEGGLSRQHVVVGTVRYGSGDRGILVYLKSSLSGDESANVLQYKVSNPSFPHDGTINQFYSESQWESYRRLGKHIARAAVRAADALPGQRTRGQLFGRLWKTWFPTPLDMTLSNPDLTQRWVELLKRVLEVGTVQLRKELFPELESAGETFAEPPNAEDRSYRTVLLIHEATTLFEDVWDGGAFEAAWDHPLKRGWVNAVERWTLCPTFQRWWPLIKPMYSPRFTKFLEDRTSILTAQGNESERCSVEEVSETTSVPTGFADYYWRLLRSDKGMPLVAGQRLFAFLVKRPLDGPEQPSLQAGLVRLVWDAGAGPADGIARWHEPDFFLPPGLSGSGLRSRFLKALLDKLEQGGVSRVEISFRIDDQLRPARSEYSRLSEEASIQFYRQFGFKVSTTGDAHTLSWSSPRKGRDA